MCQTNVVDKSRILFRQIEILQKIPSLGNIKMGQTTNQLLFSHFNEGNKKVRNFNENINFS